MNGKIPIEIAAKALGRDIFKTCNVCEEIKSLQEFHKNRTTRDGRQGICKLCRKGTNYGYYSKFAKKHVKSCVYKIKCGDSYYFGSTTNPYVREAKHKSLLNKGDHYNRPLQEAFNTTGSYIFEIVGHTNNHREVEKFLIIQLKEHDKCCNQKT